MRPTIICHMIASLDGSLHPSRCTASPDGTRAQWSEAYEAIHRTLGADAWLIGRVTMAEMSKAGPHAPASHGPVERPVHIAPGPRTRLGIALDPAGKLHFAGPEVAGDRVLVLLGPGVPDSHLAELAADGISYVVSDTPQIDLPATLSLLYDRFAIRTLLLEGGATVNGTFFAAGLVDELSLLFAPILEGRVGIQSIIESGTEGLAGRAELSFRSSEALPHGLVHLRYAVTRPA